jgi:hypothetical protein
MKLKNKLDLMFENDFIRLPRWHNDNNYVPDDTYDFCNSVPVTNSTPRQPLKLDGFKF